MDLIDPITGAVQPVAVESSSANFVDLAVVALAAYALIGLVMGLFIIFAAWRMMQLRAYELSMAGSCLAVLPYSIFWLLGLPMGIWALVVLRRPEVRAAFPHRTTEDQQRDGGAPPKPPAQQVQGPAIGLLVAGMLHFAGFFHIAVLLLVLLVDSVPKGQPLIPTLILAAYVPVGLALGVVLFLGSWRMMQLRSYGWAIAASIFALIPYSLASLITLPLGIWALVVLRRPEVQAAFARNLPQPRPPERQVRAPGIALLGIGLLELVGCLTILIGINIR
jgi:hypothetical protein